MDEQRSVRRGDATGERSSRTRRRQSEGPRHSALGERFIAGVPASIMRPRLVFITCLAAIMAFGLLMVYSASSVESLKENGSSTYFLVRQAEMIALGAVICAGLIFMPKRWYENNAIWGAWVLLLLSLVAVMLVGRGSRGATRWLSIAGVQFQPSEFAKPILVVLMAKLFDEFYNGRIDGNRFVFKTFVALSLPLGLTFLQPDFGTVLIVVLTVLFMALMAGANWKTVVGIVGFVVILCVIAAIAQPYRIMRLQVALHPWEDEFGDGYQATLAIMAFASGGLFGRGIGNSTIKYNYLPEAHNDYILAIVGEELGFVGTVLFFIVFLVMIVAAFKIASRAASRREGLMAGGCAVILFVQFLVNALGILNVIPMTGKPLPFISYGGSAILTCMSLAAIIIRVSLDSNRKSVYDRRRDGFAVVDESTAGTPVARSTHRSGNREGFSVVDGLDVLHGDAGAAPARPTPRSDTGRTVRTASYRRVVLNADPASRLREDEGPHVRGTGYRGSSRKDRYDR